MSCIARTCAQLYTLMTIVLRQEASLHGMTRACRHTKRAVIGAIWEHLWLYYDVALLEHDNDDEDEDAAPNTIGKALGDTCFRIRE